MQRPGQGRRPSPHPPPTEGREERRDSASPGPHGPRPRGQDSPGRAEKPRPNPTPAWSPGGREGSCRGRAMDGPPHPRQRCQVDSDTQHPQSRPRGFSAHPPTRCQGRAPPGSPPDPVQLFSPHNTLCNAPLHLKLLWLAPSQQTLGQGSTKAFKQTGRVRDGERRGPGQRAEAARGVERWLPDSAETQAWGTLTLSLLGSPWHFLLGTGGPGKGDCPRPQPTAQLHTGAIWKGPPVHLEGDWRVLASHKVQDLRAPRKGANVPGGRGPYPEAGASWAHRAPADPPGRAGGRAHRHVHPGGTVPASSGHSPGSQDRQLHLGRKQRKKRVSEGLTQPLPRSGAVLATPPPPQSWPSQAPAIVLGRPCLPCVRDQNQEDKQA